MKTKSLRLVTATLMAVSFPLASGCTSPDGEEGMTEGPSTGLDGTSSPTSSSSDGSGDSSATGETSGADDGMSSGDTTTSDATTSSDDTTSTTTSGDECENYRSMYPAGPYGVGSGDVLAEMPGMVLPDGTMTGLNDIYADKSKIALMLVNAFDT